MATSWAHEESGFHSQQWQKGSLIFHNVQTCSEAHPVPYAMDTMGSFSKSKASVGGGEVET
jgi:hypothetical protein